MSQCRYHFQYRRAILYRQSLRSTSTQFMLGTQQVYCHCSSQVNLDSNHQQYPGHRESFLETKGYFLSFSVVFESFLELKSISERYSCAETSMVCLASL